MKTVLIVDDNMENNYYLEVILKAKGFNVITAKNGSEAWESAHAKLPDMIISDILMPVMDGFELCRKWKADEQLKKIPFIFYTATYTEPKDEEFALSLGADRFILKPQDPEILINTVTELFEEKYKEGSSSDRPLGDEMEFFRQYNAILFKKLEKKVLDLEITKQELGASEALLKKNELKYRALLDNAADSILVADTEGNILESNKKAEELFGYTKEELQGMKLTQIHPEEELKRVIHAFTGIKEGTLNSLSNTKILRKDGISLPVDITGTNIEYAGQRLIQGIFRDITERVKTDQKIVQLAAIMESSDDAIIGKTLDGIITSWNKGAENIYGYSESDATGRPISMLAPPGHEDEMQQIIDRIKSEEHIEHYETMRRRRDGQHICVSLTASPIRDKEGRIIGASTITRDITEQKKMQALHKLDEARLESLLKIAQYECESIQDLLNFALDEAISLTGSKIGYIYFYNDQKKEFTLNTWSRDVMKECTIAEPQTVYHLEKTGIWGEAVRQARPVVLNDFQSPNPLKKGYPEGHARLYKYLTIPVFSDGHIVAVVGVANKETDYEESDTRQLTLLMDPVWKLVSKKQTEELLLASEARLRAQYQGSPIPNYTWRKKGEVFELVDCNRAAKIVSKGEIIKYLGKTSDELYQDRPQILKDMQLCFAEKKVVQREHKSSHFMPGRTVIASYAFVPPDMIMLYAEDITELKKTVQMIEESRTVLRSLIDAVGEALFMIDDEGKILVANQTASQRLSVNVNDLMGARFYDFFTSGISAMIKERVNTALQTGKRVSLEYEDFERIYINNIYPIMEKGCSTGKAVIFSSDITEQRLMQQYLRKSEEKYRSIFENVTEGIFQSTPEGRYLNVNPAFARMFGFETPQEMIDNVGNIAQELYVDPEKRVLAEESFERYGSFKGFEMEMYRKDRTKFWISMNTRAVRDKNGKILYYEGTVLDITNRVIVEERMREMLLELEAKNKELQKAYEELKDSQTKIIQSEKMASIGQIAAGVAHEINNPTGFVISNLYALRDYMERMNEFYNLQERVFEKLLGSDVKQQELILDRFKTNKHSLKIDFIREDTGNLIKESIDGAERIKKIVQDLRSFSRLDEDKQKMVDIHDVLEATLNIVWNEIKYKATLKKEYGNIPLTKCNPGQLSQVFMNLLVNAAQAIEQKGEITIRTQYYKPYIDILISDTGCGISEEHKKRLFEPFFTTKEIGKGTGLGLSISYDIIRKHNGDILVESRKGEGTTFTVRVPVKV